MPLSTGNKENLRHHAVNRFLRSGEMAEVCTTSPHLDELNCQHNAILQDSAVI